MSITRLVWYIFLFVFQDGEDDVRQLACYPYYRLLRFHPLFVLEVLRSKARIPADGNPCSLDDQRSKLLVPPEGLLAMHDFLTTAVARWYQAEIGGKLVLVAEPFHVTDLRQDAHGSDETYSWDGSEQIVPAPKPFCLTHLAQLARSFQQGASNDFHLPDEQVE